MTLDLSEYRVHTASVVDDDGSARETYGYTIEDLNLKVMDYEPGPKETPVRIDSCLKRILAESQALLCDHHLRKHSYAQFNGAELAGLCYRRRFPAVLCTKYEHAEIVEIRSYRQLIPALLNPEEMSPESLREGWQVCVEEFHGRFRENRRSWRTQVRVEGMDVERKTVLVILPGWNSTEGLSIAVADLPSSIQRRLSRACKKGDLPVRLHARANVGTERPEELFLFAWEEV